jgi:sucrose-6-phosphate hydrolase SacC (GH32 family)
MSFPRELTLRTTPEGPRIGMMPVREIETIWGRKHSLADIEIAPGENPLANLRAELWDVDATIDLGHARELVFSARGEPIRYDVKTATLRCRDHQAPLWLRNGRLRLRVLIDRTSVEVFADEGLVQMCMGSVLDPSNRSLALTVQGGKATLRTVTAHELRSAWP